MTGSVWAALLVGVAAGNPARRAVALAAATPSARWRGAAVTCIVLGALAAAAGAILGALESTVPTVLVAAGIVVGATALAEVLAGPPAALAGVDAPGAWAAPIAFPHLLRPQLAMAALAAGAAHGLLVGALVAVIAPVLSVVMVGRLGPVANLTALGRLIAAAGVLGSVDLVMDGIFSV